MKPNYEKHWTEAASKLLLGKRVTGVRYLSQDEAKEIGWDSRSLVIEFEGGLSVFPSQDDEGNGAGALFTTDDKVPTLPVFFVNDWR